MTPTSPLLFAALAEMPVSAFSAISAPGIYKRIVDSGTNTAGQVLDAIERGDANSLGLEEQELHGLREAFRRGSDPFPPFDELLSSHRQRLDERLQRGWIHPRLRWKGMSPKSLMNFSTQQMERGGLFRVLCEINESVSVSDELADALSASERDLRIFFDRFGRRQKTLEAIGDEIGATRERIRQIEAKTQQAIWERIVNSPAPLLKSAFYHAEDLGAELCLSEWTSALRSRGCLGEFHPDHPAYRLGFTSSEALFALIRSSRRLSLTRDLVSENLHQAARIPDLPVSAIKLLENMPARTRRQILRSIGYTGGIHLEDVGRIVQDSDRTIRHFLESQGLLEVIPGWYSFSGPEQFRKCPIENAGLKMFEACGLLPFQVFCDGLRKHASRFYPGLAPADVLKHLLRLYDFIVDDDQVTY